MADLLATILLPAPDLTHADEVNVFEEDREKEIHDEGNPAIDNEQDEKGDDFAEGEGLVEGDKDHETAEEAEENEEVEGNSEEEREEDEGEGEEKAEEPGNEYIPEDEGRTQENEQVEEVLAATRTRESKSDHPVDETEVEDGADKGYVAQCTRKGKQPAVTAIKKPSGSKKRSEPTTAPIKVPFAQDTEEDAGEDDEDSRDDSTMDPIYLPDEVVVTKKLLGEMAYFSDPKKARTYVERGTKGKQAKSGKTYHPESLQEIESEEEFLSYISAKGFEWLLSHSIAEVPVALAKEFFTSFKFKSTTDIDTDSISFRLFNVDTTMSIRE